MKIECVETRSNTNYYLYGKGYKMEIDNECSNTRSGFKHETTLTFWNDNLKCGNTTTYNKCNYYNRTWEYFTFESCIYGAFEKLLKHATKNEKVSIKRIRDTFIKRVKDHKNIKYRYIYA